MALDLSNLRTLPGLSHRPNFPRDLHILLLDPDFKARQEVEAQLRDNHYTVTPCSCSFEAAAHLASPEQQHFDLVLADVRCMQQKSAEHTAVVQAAKTIPLVLMSETGAPNEVMLGIRIGAVDFLEKPLSPLKLKNIWQHLVRRMLTVNNSASAHQKKGASANANAAGSGTASPEDSGSQGGGSGAHSHGCAGGESGSHASTSDQAPMKVECDADMETSSFQDAINCMDALTAGMARARAADTMQCDVSGPSGNGAACLPMGTSKSRPHAHKYKANRSSMPGNVSLAGAPAAAATAPSGGGATASGAGGTGSSGGPKPAIGHPAGQMPALPPGYPGIAWGLPTNPLQISPKAPVGMGGMMGSMPMGWPQMGGPMGHMGSAMGLFPAAAAAMMMSGATQSPSVSSVGGCHGGPMGHHPMGGGGSMPMSASCMALPTLSHNTNAAMCMKRADSAPLPAVSCISSGSAATTMTGMTGMGMAGLGLGGMGMCGGGGGGDGLMAPPPARPMMATMGSVGGSMSKADLFVGMETGKSQQPPIGLQLKKSASLVDIISQTLKHSAALPTF